MIVEANLKSKRLYKIELFVLKLIPIVLSAIVLLNTVLSYLYIDIPILSYLGGVSILPLLFLYLSSYVFKFCTYHRMFLHYVTINWVLNIVDYYIGIPLSDKNMLLVYIILAGLCLLIVVFLIFRCRNKIEL